MPVFPVHNVTASLACAEIMLMTVRYEPIIFKHNRKHPLIFLTKSIPLESS